VSDAVQGHREIRVDCGMSTLGPIISLAKHHCFVKVWRIRDIDNGHFITKRLVYQVGQFPFFLA
jgi:hypothetical protein